MNGCVASDFWQTEGATGTRNKLKICNPYCLFFFYFLIWLENDKCWSQNKWVFFKVLFLTVTFLMWLARNMKVKVVNSSVFLRSTACDSYWSRIRRDQSQMSVNPFLVNLFPCFIHSIHFSKLQRWQAGRGSREVLHNKLSADREKKIAKPKPIKNPLLYSRFLKS